MSSTCRDLKRYKAKFAFQAVDCVKNKFKNEDSKKNEDKNKVLKNFRSHIKDIPMYIYTNGIIATLAFIKKKESKDESYKKIDDILIEYMSYINDNLKNIDDIIEWLINCNEKEYRRITLEALSILEWLIKFSDTIVVEGESNGN